MKRNHQNVRIFVQGILIIMMLSSLFFSSVLATPPHPTISLTSITVFNEGRIEIQTLNASEAGREISNFFIILRAPDGYRQVGEPKLWYPKDSSQFNYSNGIVMNIKDIAPTGILDKDDRIIIQCDGGVPDGRWEFYIGQISTSYACGGWTWITGPHYQWSGNYSAQYSYADANSDPLGYFHFVSRWSPLNIFIVLVIVVPVLLVILFLYRKYRTKDA